MSDVPYYVTQRRNAPGAGAADARNEFAVSCRQKSTDLQALLMLEGGTRTPDTRIMIPNRFGSRTPLAAAGDRKGDTNAGYEPALCQRVDDSEVVCPDTGVGGDERESFVLSLGDQQTVEWIAVV